MSETEWETCQGELVHLGQQLRRQDRREMMVRAGSFFVVVAAAGLAGGVYVMQPGEKRVPVAAISCDEVHHLATSYAQHTLDSELELRVATHLDRCPRCHDYYVAEGAIES